jgi:hypothetical protein
MKFLKSNLFISFFVKKLSPVINCYNSQVAKGLVVRVVAPIYLGYPGFICVKMESKKI